MNFAKRVLTHPYVKRALTLGGASVAAGATFVGSFPYVEDAFWVWKDPGRVSEKSSLTLSSDGVLDCSKAAGKMKDESECPEDGSASRQRLVVLGSGWASCSILKKIDRDKFDVTVISPRNHFAYTPLLPSVRGLRMPLYASLVHGWFSYRVLSCTGSIYLSHFLIFIFTNVIILFAHETIVNCIALFSSF
mmetsp:Transcript_23924/g.49401  ORF Transcript_23924/g.49401 Transcript_23924/m.49401 type:complete len:191 (-) Transcript_23924:2998-3570(-)